MIPPNRPASAANAYAAPLVSAATISDANLPSEPARPATFERVAAAALTPPQTPTRSVAASQPPPSSLEAWRDAPGISDAERDERRIAANRIREWSTITNWGEYAVQGNLSLAHMTHLTSLPPGLYVQGHLNLSLCTSLRSLPADLFVEGHLFLTGCTALVSIPLAFMQQEHTYNGQPRYIDFCGIDFPPEGLRMLQAAQQANPHLHCSWNDYAPHRAAENFCIRITRNGDVFAQAMTAYAGKAPDFFQHAPYIIFDDEIGIDAGGLRKDFMNLVLREVFDIKQPLFTMSALFKNHLEPKRGVTLSAENVEQLRFAGRFVAMTHLYGLPLPVSFSDTMLAAARRLDAPLPDAPTTAELLALWNLFDAPAATMCASIQHLCESDLSHFEMADGSPVTEDNVDSYIHESALLAVSHYWTHQYIFWSAVREVLGAERYGALIELPIEEQRTQLSGQTGPIDLEDWQLFTTVPQGHLQLPIFPRVRDAFFAALAEMSDIQRRRVLYLATGYSNPPADGFLALEPRLFNLLLNAETTHLPVAHSCFNQLEIPCCTDKSEMRTKLEMFIALCPESFNLS